MSVLREIALIILALESGLITLLILVMLAAANYGLFRSRWWQALPRMFSLARGYIGMGQQVVERACRAAMSPIVATETRRATVESWIRTLLGRAVD